MLAAAVFLSTLGCLCSLAGTFALCVAMRWIVL